MFKPAVGILSMAWHRVLPSFHSFNVDNGMSMLDVDSYWQMIVKGSILVVAVWVDVSTRTGRR